MIHTFELVDKRGVLVYVVAQIPNRPMRHVTIFKVDRGLLTVFETKTFGSTEEELVAQWKTGDGIADYKCSALPGVNIYLPNPLPDHL